MTLSSLPKNIYRVRATGHSTEIFTTRDEVRDYRSTLRSQGVTASQMSTTRFTVEPVTSS